jgi:hypothetical protein
MVLAFTCIAIIALGGTAMSPAAADYVDRYERRICRALRQALVYVLSVIQF